MSKILQRDLKSKIPVYLQDPKWDSSDDDNDSDPKTKKRVVEDERKKKHRSQKSMAKSTKKSQAGMKYDSKSGGNGGDEGDENDLVLYIGHLPKDFEEKDLRRFLSQFGKVYNCRVARKIETGKPKGFAFVKFEDDEVVQIVCETLHGYFLDKQRLVCQVRPSHPGMFFDTDKMIDSRHKKLELERKQRNRNLGNPEKLKAITSRLVIREVKKRERLKALGIDYDFPGYKSNRSEFEEHFMPDEDIDIAELDDDNASTSITACKNGGIQSNRSNSKSVSASDDESSRTESQEASEKKNKKRKMSLDENESKYSEGSHKRLTKSAKKAKKKEKKKRRTSAP